MQRTINPNLRQLVTSYRDGKRGVLLEGSSRSGKTFSCIEFIIYIAVRLKARATINIVKESYNSFKTTLYDDFNRILPKYGLYSPFQDKKEVDSFKILDCKINLLGADKPSKFHGASCDFLYINEILDVSKEVFDQAEMRCREFWFADFNPKVSDHYVFKSISNRPDVDTLKTTFKDNPHISVAEKNKILGYRPTKENVLSGTADDYMWSVYGLGERTPPEGLIFKHPRYIDKFPSDLGYVYGIDFGFTVDPTAIVKVGETEKDIFLEPLLYEPVDSPQIIHEFAEEIEMNILIPSIADSSDKYVRENKGAVEMVRDLRDLGWEISKVKKTKSVMYWLGKMKEKRINVVMNALGHHAKNELDNYRMRTVNGIAINQPIDKFNHFVDAGRYGFMGLNSTNAYMI